jgi:hydroxylaminobenzene mutase
MQMPIDLRLARHGVVVLLLGLLTGFAIPNFHNPHVGDAAHLVGLIGGYGIIALGLLWPRLSLGRFLSGAGAWMIAVSMYLNWLGCILLGAFGSGPTATNSAMMGSPLLWDRAGQVALLIGAWLSLVATIVVLVGLRKLTAPAETRGAMPAAVTTK